MALIAYVFPKLETEENVTAPLSYFLITLTEIELENLSLSNI